MQSMSGCWCAGACPAAAAAAAAAVATHHPLWVWVECHRFKLVVQSLQEHLQVVVPYVQGLVPAGAVRREQGTDKDMDRKVGREVGRHAADTASMDQRARIHAKLCVAEGQVVWLDKGDHHLLRAHCIDVPPSKQHHAGALPQQTQVGCCGLTVLPGWPLVLHSWHLLHLFPNSSLSRKILPRQS